MDIADRAQLDDERADIALEHLKLRRLVQAPDDEGSLRARDCEDCGTPLSMMRRKAMPTATRCMPCQADFESLERRGMA